MPDKSQAERWYKQDIKSPRDYNFGHPTVIYFGANSFQPINQWSFPFYGSSIFI